MRMTLCIAIGRHKWRGAVANGWRGRETAVTAGQRWRQFVSKQSSVKCHLFSQLSHQAAPSPPKPSQGCPGTRGSTSQHCAIACDPWRTQVLTCSLLQIKEKWQAWLCLEGLCCPYCRGKGFTSQSGKLSQCRLHLLDPILVISFLSPMVS